MPRNTTALPPEFRAEAVELIRSGTKTIRSLSRDLSVSDQPLRNWLRQTDVEAGRRHPRKVLGMDLARIAILPGVLVGFGGMGLTFHFQNEYLRLNRARGYPDGRVGRGKAMPRTPEFHCNPDLREAWQRMIQRERWSVAVAIGGPLLGLLVAGLVRHSLL